MPQRAGRILKVVLGTAAMLVLLVLQSAAPVPGPNGDDARLRLSWRARPERIEVCRQVSDDELAKLGEHMRRRIECTGRFATYALTVALDGHTLHSAVVRGAGLRNDRPVFLLDEIALPPGKRRLRVVFQRREQVETSEARDLDSVAGAFEREPASRARRETMERARRSGAAIPPLLQLDTVIEFQAGRVVLVTLDGERRGFRVLTQAD